MRRILVLLAVVALVLLMMAMSVAPAFADHTTGHSFSQALRENIAFCLADPLGPGILECSPSLDSN